MGEQFYKKLDCILGHRPASTPVTLLDSASTITETTLDTDSDPDPEKANGKFHCLKKTCIPYPIIILCRWKSDSARFTRALPPKKLTRLLRMKQVY